MYGWFRTCWFAQESLNVWALCAHHTGNGCPSLGLSMPKAWSQSAQGLVPECPLDGQDTVILPFTLLRRLDCVLEDKYEAILDELSKCEENLKKYKLQALMKKNGITFFNMSGLSLKKLLNAPDHIGDSFKNDRRNAKNIYKDIEYDRQRQYTRNASFV